MLQVRDATPDDAQRLAPRLRAADLREIRAMTRQPPVDVLRGGILASDPCHAVVGEDGAPVAVFGVVPDRAVGSGALWLLGADEIVATPYLFLRESRAWIERLLARYETLRVVIDARNDVHVKWLGWCGFSLRRTLPRHGVERRTFYELARSRPALHDGAAARPEPS
jgi:hypothetical protein